MTRKKRYRDSESVRNFFDVQLSKAKPKLRFGIPDSAQLEVTNSKCALSSEIVGYGY